MTATKKRSPVSLPSSTVFTASTAWVPRPYQKKALKFILENPGSGLLLDPGLGKTSVFLAMMLVLQKKAPSTAALVIAPRRVAREVWPEEIREWTDFHGLSLGLLHGPKKDQVVDEVHALYVVTPEGLQWLTQRQVLPNGKLGPSPWMKLRKRVSVLGVDESSYFKDTSSNRFRTLRGLLPHFKRRHIMSGSIQPNNLQDVFAPAYICDLGKTLGPYITHFRQRWFTRGEYWQYFPINGAADYVKEKLRPIMLSMLADDYLDLPPILDNLVYVELPDNARSLYNELEEEFFAKWDDDEVTAVNAGVAVAKLRQVASGGVYVDSIERRWRQIHNAKDEAIKELVDELHGAPLLIAYQFKHDVERLRKLLGKDTPVIGGGTTDAEAKRYKAAWNAGELPCLIGHPASMGHGLNMQKSSCEHVAYYSLPYNLDHYYQFIRRVRRQGSKARRVVVHHLMARDTVDSAILWSLRAKGAAQNALLEALRRYRVARK